MRRPRARARPSSRRCARGTTGPGVTRPRRWGTSGRRQLAPWASCGGQRVGPAPGRGQWGLGKLGATEALPDLRALLSDTSEYVRNCAATAIETMTREPPEDTGEVGIPF